MLDFLAFSLHPYLLCKLREPFFPIFHGFVGELEASQQKELSQVLIA